MCHTRMPMAQESGASLCCLLAEHLIPSSISCNLTWCVFRSFNALFFLLKFSLCQMIYGLGLICGKINFLVDCLQGEVFSRDQNLNLYIYNLIRSILTTQVRNMDLRPEYEEICNHTFGSTKQLSSLPKRHFMQSTVHLFIGDRSLIIKRSITRIAFGNLRSEKKSLMSLTKIWKSKRKNFKRINILAKIFIKNNFPFLYLHAALFGMHRATNHNSKKKLLEGGKKNPKIDICHVIFVSLEHPVAHL
ncbi:hypothetical protein ACJX0J_009369, partial [Zea mays]